MRAATSPEHVYTHDTDTCRCGGQWVYFDDDRTHGCEVAGPGIASATNALDVPGLPLDTTGRARCVVCRSTVQVRPCDGLGALCEACSMECPCDRCANR